jgi:hypothetical protein
MGAAVQLVEDGDTRRHRSRLPPSITADAARNVDTAALMRG